MLPVREIKIIANRSKYLEDVGDYAIANCVFNETAMGKMLASVAFKGDVTETHYIVSC